MMGIAEAIVSDSHGLKRKNLIHLHTTSRYRDRTTGAARPQLQRNHPLSEYSSTSRWWAGKPSGESASSDGCDEDGQWTGDEICCNRAEATGVEGVSCSAEGAAVGEKENARGRGALQFRARRCRADER